MIRDLLARQERAQQGTRSLQVTELDPEDQSPRPTPVGLRAPVDARRPKALGCPYCSSDVMADYAGEGDAVVIECDNVQGCGATWDAGGDPLVVPKLTGRSRP